ncbi:MAG: tetratricopeptide repeat protein [Clostridia bacterium]|nr:tetratricopeptide repeat protein [Clostridia bacterium]
MKKKQSNCKIIRAADHADNVYNRAMYAWEAGNYPLAVDMFERAICLCPDYLYFDMYATMCSQTGNLNRAACIRMVMCEIFGDLSDNYLYLAQDYARMGLEKESCLLLAHSAHKEQDDEDYSEERRFVLEEMHEEALQRRKQNFPFRVVYPESEQLYRQRLTEARAHLEHYETDKARELLQTVPICSKSYAQAAALLGACSFFEEKEAESIEIYQRALSKYPNDIFLLCSAITIYLALCETEKAEPLLDRLSKQKTDDPELLFKMLSVFEATGRHKDALPICKKLAVLMPFYPGVYHSLTQVYYNLGQKSDAIKTLKDALLLRTKDAFLLTLIEVIEREEYAVLDAKAMREIRETAERRVFLELAKTLSVAPHNTEQYDYDDYLYLRNNILYYMNVSQLPVFMSGFYGEDAREELKVLLCLPTIPDLVKLSLLALYLDYYTPKSVFLSLGNLPKHLSFSYPQDFDTHSAELRKLYCTAISHAISFGEGAKNAVKTLYPKIKAYADEAQEVDYKAMLAAYLLALSGALPERVYAIDEVKKVNRETVYRYLDEVFHIKIEE